MGNSRNLLVALTVGAVPVTPVTIKAENQCLCERRNRYAVNVGDWRTLNGIVRCAGRKKSDIGFAEEALHLQIRAYVCEKSPAKKIRKIIRDISAIIGTI